MERNFDSLGVKFDPSPLKLYTVPQDGMRTQNKDVNLDKLRTAQRGGGRQVAEVEGRDRVLNVIGAV